MANIKIADVMTAHVRLCAPNDTIQDAARTMKEMDVGLLPVGENDRLVGTITERDIVIRALAAGKGADSPVKDAMSTGIRYCFDTDTIDEVAEKMSAGQIRRLPVLNDQKRLVGIVSLGDISKAEEKQGAKALKGTLTEEQALNQVGAAVAGMVQAKIASNIPPALAPETIERKGSSVALIDTGQLRSSITWQVE